MLGAMSTDAIALFFSCIATFSRHFLRQALLCAFSLLILAGCRESKKYQYTVPDATNDGWAIASLSSQSLAAEPIKQLFDRINDSTYKNIHSVLLVKNGKLVVEEYFSGQDSSGKYHAFDRNTLHEMHSTTKSVNSILIGIAIDQHLIDGVDQTISTLFPAYSDVFSDAKKRDLLEALAHDDRRFVMG